MAYEVKVSHPFFKRSVRKCRKHSRRPDEDLEPALSLLEKEPSRWGTPVGETERYRVYKLRVADSTQPGGKSSGYRLIYAVAEAEHRVICLFLYHKTQIENANIEQLLKQIKAQAPEGEDPFALEAES